MKLKKMCGEFTSALKSRVLLTYERHAPALRSYPYRKNYYLVNYTELVKANSKKASFLSRQLKYTF